MHARDLALHPPFLEQLFASRQIQYSVQEGDGARGETEPRFVIGTLTVDPQAGTIEYVLKPPYEDSR